MVLSSSKQQIELSQHAMDPTNDAATSYGLMRSEIDTDRHFHYRSIHQTQTHCHRHRNSTTSPSRYGRRYGGWLASMMAALTLLQRVADKPMHRRNTDHSNATTRHHLQHIHAGRFLSQHYSVVRHYRHHLYLW